MKCKEALTLKVSMDCSVIVIMPNSFPKFTSASKAAESPYLMEWIPCKTLSIGKFAEGRMNLIDENPEEGQRLSSLFGQYYRRATARVVKGVQGWYEVASGVMN